MEAIKDDRDNLSPSSDSSDSSGSNGTPKKTRMIKSQVHTTKAGTQYVNVVDVIQSETGWAEIERILDANLVQKPSSKNGNTPSPPKPNDAA